MNVITLPDGYTGSTIQCNVIPVEWIPGRVTVKNGNIRLISGIVTLTVNGREWLHRSIDVDSWYAAIGYSPSISGRQLDRIESDSFKNSGMQSILYSEDVEFIHEFVAFPDEYRNEITAVQYIIGDGDVLAVWLSESARPYDLYSTWNPLPFYRPDEWNTAESLNRLPEYWLEWNEFYNPARLPDLLEALNEI